MWSRMSLFPLAHALKHELIISKAIRSVTSRYIHIPMPIPGSLLPFLAPVLSFSLPLLFFKCRACCSPYLHIKISQRWERKVIYSAPLPLLYFLSYYLFLNRGPLSLPPNGFCSTWSAHAEIESIQIHVYER